jgi:small GTP-binding protein
MTAPNEPQIAAALEALHGALGDVAFSLSGPEDDPREVNRRRLIKSINEYALPRVTRSIPVPVVVVIAGASGVGKSTVLNSLAQTEVSSVSLARPTTRHPVIWANRRPADDFWGQFIGRVQDVAGRHVDVVVGEGELASDVVLIDTPPLDHTRGSFAAPAEEMLTMADLCIFVTSASRYADAAPYEFLASANRQGVPVLFVLNKTPSDPWLSVDLVNDFAARLSRRGLLPTPNPNLIFRLTLDPLPRSHQGLDVSAISPLRDELEALADPQFRDEIVRQTTAASLRAITQLGAELAADLRVDAARAVALRGAIDDAYVAQSRRLQDELNTGTFAALARRKSFTEAAAELAGIVTRRAGVASGKAAGAWERLAGGDALLIRGGAGLYRHGEDTPYEAVEVIEQWEQAATERAAADANGRVSGRTRRRIGRFMWQAALDPDRKPPSVVARKFGGTTDSVVEATRDSLSGALIAALGVDAERFWSLVRDPVPEERIVALEDAIALLVRATTGEPDHPVEADLVEMPDLSDVGEFTADTVPVLAAPIGETHEVPDA